MVRCNISKNACIKINTITSDRIEVNLVEQGFEKDNIWVINR